MKALTVSLHVSHGYVGNRACKFPLQYWGWDVDAVNTTNFSNHPGYGKIGGSVVAASEVQLVLEGLETIVGTTNEYSLAICGYCPRPDTVEVLRGFLGRLGLDAALVVDPVLGDNGRLYVHENVVPQYQRLLKECSVALTTPNQFEFELLSGCKVATWSDLNMALVLFHKAYNVPSVVVLSIEVEGALYSVGATQNEKLDIHESSGTTINSFSIFYFPIRKLDCNFNGSGDVFTALLSHRFVTNGCKLTPRVLNDALVQLEQILIKSMQIDEAATGKPPKHVKDIQIVALRAVLDTQPEMRQVHWLQK